jgi:2,4-dienoyl-CoA reductase-like NADH-dependent reductase (Old Yellow Enzyme family)
MNQKQFIKLFEPGWIGSMELKNRLVMPPMGTNYASKDGSVTQRQIDYYEVKGRSWTCYRGDFLCRFSGG